MGTTQRKNRKNYSVEYGALHNEIGQFTEKYISLHSHSHSAVCNQTLVWMQDMAAGQEPDYGSSASVTAGEVELVAELRRDVLSMDAVGCFIAPTAEVGSRYAEQRNYLIQRHRQCSRHKLCDDVFARSLLGALENCTVLWVHGKCGSGKSTKVPCSLEKVSTRGLVHVLSKKKCHGNNTQVV